MVGKREWGSENRGGDDDGDSAGLTTKKVQIENAYFEQLKERMGQKPATGVPATGGSDKPAGPVIYNDDGSVYKKSA